MTNYWLWLKFSKSLTLTQSSAKNEPLAQNE